MAREAMLDTLVHRGLVLLVAVALGTNTVLIGAQIIGLDHWQTAAAIVTMTIAILTAAGRLNSAISKFHRDFLMIMVEHEMVMRWFCDQTGQDLEDLPTRKVRK